MENSSISSLRRESDLRQIAGFLLVLGMCAVFQPLTGVTSAISPDGATPTSGIPFASLFGGLCIFSIGTLSVFIGFSQLIMGWGNKFVTLIAILLVQTAFIPYITGMTNVGQMARTGAAFIPAAYNPTPTDVRYVGSCGIMAIMAYGFAFIGSASFMLFSLYKYQSGKYNDRNASYFRGRGAFYSGILAFAGTSQLVLAAYLHSKFGSLDHGAIRVAQYTINFPGISMFLGCMQLSCGLWGVARNTFKEACKKDNSFQFVMFVAWVFQVVLQVLTQVGYSPGDMYSGAAPTVTGFTVGLNLMPAYLDYKARSTPTEISKEYYEDEELNDGEEEKGYGIEQPMDA